MSEKSENSGGRADPPTLVRGPDGTLWLITKEEAPEKITGHKKKEVEGIIEDTEKRLADQFPRFAHTGVHVGDDVFEKGQHTHPSAD